MANQWGSNFIRLPLSWLGADVYFDQTAGTLCYEADGQHLVELSRDCINNGMLKYRPRPISEGK